MQDSLLGLAFHAKISLEPAFCKEEGHAKEFPLQYF